MAKKIYNESELIFEEKLKHRSFQDLTGKKFNRLTVLGFAGRTHNTYWFCKCECGNITKVQAISLKSDYTTSCGCLHKERARETHTKHGHRTISQTSITYKSWKAMIDRCQNQNKKRFKDYGGRGIKVCKRWHKFENFLEDMGERPKGKTLDRKENNKGYYLENCRWADKFEQANNTRRSRFITHNGKTQTVTQWNKELGFNENIIFGRLKLGWSVERALTTPT